MGAVTGLADYIRVKVKVWEFIDKFRGKGFSMGDARAYVSLLADLNIAGGEKDYAEALYRAYKEALSLYKSKGPPALAEDYKAKVGAVSYTHLTLPTILRV